MTCIVGLVIVGLVDKETGTVYIGGDSAGSADTFISIRADEKVFNNGPFIMGFCGSFRMGQLLRYKFDPPRQTVNQDDMKYMVSTFIDSVRKCFGENGFGKTPDKDDNRGCTFLVGYNGKLYTIMSDFQVAQLHDNYYAIGSGADLALGSLYSTVGLKDEDRITIALEAASKFNSAVAAPFVVVKQEANLTGVNLPEAK